VSQPDCELLRTARRRLGSKQLLQVGDTLSLRLPGTAACLLALGSADSGDADVVQHPLDKPGGSPPSELHRLVYLARPDVGAILIGRQRWASALPVAGGTLPGVFDEQLRHLGWKVTQITTPATPEDARARLAGAANAFGLERADAVGGKRAVLCLGMTLERLVFNAELLEKCAQAYVLARASGLPVRRVPWLVGLIATRRLRRDQRRAAVSHARGEAAARVAGY